MKCFVTFCFLKRGVHLQLSRQRQMSWARTGNASSALLWQLHSDHWLYFEVLCSYFRVNQYAEMCKTNPFTVSLGLKWTATKFRSTWRYFNLHGWNLAKCQKDWPKDTTLKAGGEQGRDSTGCTTAHISCEPLSSAQRLRIKLGKHCFHALGQKLSHKDHGQVFETMFYKHVFAVAKGSVSSNTRCT